VALAAEGKQGLHMGGKGGGGGRTILAPVAKSRYVVSVGQEKVCVGGVCVLSFGGSMALLCGGGWHCQVGVWECVLWGVGGLPQPSSAGHVKDVVPLQ